MTVTREIDGIWLELQETIAVHHEDVYACFTTEAGLMCWYPVEAEIDLRTGGQIVRYWNREKSPKLAVAVLNYRPGGRDLYAASPAPPDAVTSG